MKYRRLNITATPIGNGKILVKSERGDVKKILSAPQTQLLLGCRKFKTLHDHARAYCQEMRREVAQSATSLRGKLMRRAMKIAEENRIEIPVRSEEVEHAERQLSALVEDGFLISEADLLKPYLHPRRIHVYGLGAPKTGTHSIAGLFSGNYRSGHEPYFVQTTHLLKLQRSGGIGQHELTQEIRNRDCRWRLEAESAHFLAHFCDVLAEEFPQAKFILTVREPMSWLRSIIDQHIRNPREKFAASGAAGHEAWLTLRDLYFDQPPEEYSAFESLLEKYQLHSIDRYVAYWARHNQRVLDAVPARRLLVLRTCDLSGSIDRIAAFLEISPDMLTREKSHSFKALKKHGLLEKVNKSYVRDKISEHCGEILKRLRDECKVEW